MASRLALLIGLLMGSSAALAQAPRGTPCVVDRIVDGDTFYCSDRTKVRLIGVDSPERGQGKVARRATAALSRIMAPGRRVLLEGDVTPLDRYGRMLAYVWVGDTLVNEALIREGWAVRYTVPPNVKYVERLGIAERSARHAHRGLWADGELTCRPADWRQGKCAE